MGGGVSPPCSDYTSPDGRMPCWVGAGVDWGRPGAKKPPSSLRAFLCLLPPSPLAPPSGHQLRGRGELVGNTGLYCEAVGQMDPWIESAACSTQTASVVGGGDGEAEQAKARRWCLFSALLAYLKGLKGASCRGASEHHPTDPTVVPKGHLLP